MLSTSQDLLYLVSALCLLWFTVFLCWVLYQAARTLRNANKIIENVSDKLELISGAIEFIRRKVDHVSGTMGTITSLVAGMLEKMVASKISSAFERRQTERATAKRKDKAYNGE